MNIRYVGWFNCPIHQKQKKSLRMSNHCSETSPRDPKEPSSKSFNDSRGFFWRTFCGVFDFSEDIFERRNVPELPIWVWDHDLVRSAAQQRPSTCGIIWWSQKPSPCLVYPERAARRLCGTRKPVGNTGVRLPSIGWLKARARPRLVETYRCDPPLLGWRRGLSGSNRLHLSVHSFTKSTSVYSSFWNVEMEIRTSKW